LFILNIKATPMLNSIEKDIPCSLHLLTDNNLTFFQNQLYSNDKYLLLDTDYIFENSAPSQNEKNELDISLTQANKDNININFLEQNLYEFNLQRNPIIKNKFYINKTLPLPLYENDIIKIINTKMNISYNIQNILNAVSNIKNDSRIEIVKKDITEKLDTRSKRTNKRLKNKEDIKFGRKKKEDLSFRIHNKYTTDNIIIKIKNVMKKYLIIFVNNIIISLYGSKKINEIRTILNLPKHASLSLIKDINYKSIANKTRKKDNLDLLTISVEEFLSSSVSTRYRKINKEEYNNLSKYNQIIIDFLFKDNLNRDMFNFIFKNLKIEDWLNIFIYQKELNDFHSFNYLGESQKKIIEESFIKIDDIFDKLSEEGDLYFFCFLLLIYNYKRYFLIKRERQGKDKTKKLEIIKTNKIRISIDENE
jgi:hypothetical protein